MKEKKTKKEGNKRDGRVLILAKGTHTHSLS